MAQSEAPEVLTYRVEDGVGWIRLNRPRQRNALDARLRGALLQAVRQGARDESARVLVVTGEGAAFCAGADVNEFTQLQGMGPLPDEYGALLTTLRGAPKPTVAAIRGAAAGIGVALALCCDLRVAATDAFFRLAFVDIGLTVDGGATWLLPRLIGTARTLELCYTGRRLEAAEAERWGLVNQVVAPEQLESAARDLAARLARGPRGALAAMKRSVAYGEDAGFEETVTFEFLLQSTLVGSPDFKEGVSAFLEKRAPSFGAEES
ncbi:MAG: enoyl-CoA hydratase/isomerase family protein [Candidatus Dormibacteraeota bacterium]|nr:enoyl-CoA hydratase/isomerase family protein [Candidatus Dormibacteraeota bacterium]